MSPPSSPNRETGKGELTLLPLAEIFVDLPSASGKIDKYFGNIHSVHRRSASGLLTNPTTAEPHPLGTNLWLTEEEIAERDPAGDYEYTVQLFGQREVDDAEYFKASEDSAEHWGRVMITVSPDRIG